MRLEAAALFFVLFATCGFASETVGHSPGTAALTGAVAAKEHLHHSLALPTSYADVKPAPAPVSVAKEADKPSDAGKADVAVKDTPTTAAATAQLPQLPGTPCPYHEGMVHSELPSFGSVFGSILSEAAKDVFGVEQIITTNMHDMFEDIMSGPAMPKVLDMLEGAVTSAASIPTLLPPFIRGFEPRFAPALEPEADSRQPVIFNTVSSSQPVFDVVITSSSGRSADVSDADSAQPSWEQEVIISSSDPSRLQQLADMFEKQLQGSSSSSSGAGLGRRLKSVAGVRVQPADVAQVVLNVARKLRTLKAL